MLLNFDIEKSLHEAKILTLHHCDMGLFNLKFHPAFELKMLEVDTKFSSSSWVSVVKFRATLASVDEALVRLL